MSTDAESLLQPQCSRSTFWACASIFLLLYVADRFSGWHALAVVCGIGITEALDKWAERRREAAHEAVMAARRLD
ncbi:hypothetical protein [Candidatus Poriferisodalis sp.]|uniref:hypothetical protein n=1 Tax=Candidatus Poriferisodalis sp. TaxID=3101277 RepID=UPI003B02901C